jgi:hypothetical protein
MTQCIGDVAAAGQWNEFLPLSAAVALAVAGLPPQSFSEIFARPLPTQSPIVPTIPLGM